jgi:hypothetical protein
MIQEHLIAGLQKAFPDKAFQYASPPDPIATLPSPCQSLGTLAISDDGDEATVYLGRATHGHFGCYDEQLSQTQKEAKIAKDVITSLQALFADRVVVWRLAGGLADGWRVLKAGEQLPKPSHTRKQFLWSKDLT